MAKAAYVRCTTFRIVGCDTAYSFDNPRAVAPAASFRRISIQIVGRQLSLSGSRESFGRWGLLE